MPPLACYRLPNYTSSFSEPDGDKSLYVGRGRLPVAEEPTWEILVGKPGDFLPHLSICCLASPF